MTQGPAFLRPLRLSVPVAFLAALTLLAAPGTAQDFALECDVVAGIPTLRLATPPGALVRSRALDDQAWMLEVEAPRLPGLRPGAHSCAAATSVRVIPGELLGSRWSRIVVRHSGTAPQVITRPGRTRLTWLPDAPHRMARPRVVIARSAAPPVRDAPAPVSEAPSSNPDEPAPARQPREPAPEPLPAAVSDRESPAVVPTAPEAEPPPPAPPATREQRRALAAAEEATARAQGTEAPAPPPAAPPSPAPPPRALPPGYTAFDGPERFVASLLTDVKDGPGRRYRTLRKLAPGQPVQVAGRAGDWLLVGDGWTFSAFMDRAGDGSRRGLSELAQVRDLTVPVHEGPGGQHAVVAELYRGQRVVIDELQPDWAHVRNGGWVPRSALDGLD